LERVAAEVVVMAKVVELAVEMAVVAAAVSGGDGGSNGEDGDLWRQRFRRWGWRGWWR
jgi:hypothetical protein